MPSQESLRQVDYFTIMHFVFKKCQYCSCIFFHILGSCVEVSSSHCQEIGASFSGGGVRRYEYGPAFVPGEICRIFRSAGEKFLHLV